MTEIFALIYGAFLVGLIAQTHCVGMCGPIVAILGMNNSYKRVPAAILYNLGRISAYATLGVISGLIGLAISDISAIQYGIRYVAGAIMIFIALQLLGLPQMLAIIEKPLQYLWRPVRTFSHRLFPIKTALGSYSIGYVWGFLPCGAVYGPLAVAMGTGNLTLSAGIMLAFGAGTLPVMIGLAIFGTVIGHFFAKKMVRQIGGIVILVMTVYYLGWIAPQAKVRNKANMEQQRAEQIKSGDTTAKDALKSLSTMSHGKHGAKMGEHKQPNTMEHTHNPEMNTVVPQNPHDDHQSNAPINNAPSTMQAPSKEPSNHQHNH